jgi:hypothetical protein
MAAQGVKIVAPPMWYLVKAQGDEIVPSKYAQKAKAAKLKIHHVDPGAIGLHRGGRARRW